ncbi:hypothetical protein V8E51_005338 [Hyaloscypha variabilis]
MGITEALSHQRTWQPFRIDALGLITLLGASELDSAIGQLFFPNIIELLPLLAPFIISNNSFMKPVAGVTLYNITDGIVAIDISGWVVRWLMNRELSWSSATLIISRSSAFRIKDKTGEGECGQKSTKKISKRIMWHNLCSIIFAPSESQVIGVIVGTVAIIPMMLVPLLQRDWFGFLNATALLVTVITRALAVRLNRKAVSKSVSEGLDKSERGREMVKLVATLPDGKLLTIHCQRGIVKYTLLSAPQPQKWKYRWVLGVSWIALSCHVVCIGMASLIDQMVCVVIIIASTIIFVTIARRKVHENDNFGAVYRIGVGDGAMSWHLSAEHEDGRSAAYARLGLTEEEERTMCQWHLFPMRSNQMWWERYYKRPEHRLNNTHV